MKDQIEAAQLLPLLEADQVVAVKRQTRFGRRSMTPRLHALLWGMRIYVLVMLVIVALAVWHAAHA